MLFASPVVPLRENVRKATVTLHFYDGKTVPLVVTGELFRLGGRTIVEDAQDLVERMLEDAKDRGYLPWQGTAYPIASVKDIHVTYSDHVVDTRGTLCA